MSVDTVPKVWALEVTTPKLSIIVSPGVPGFTVTRKRTTVNASPGVTLPPAVALAPTPARITTWLDAATYSAWSSPAASVLAPALAPPVITIELGT